MGKKRYEKIDYNDISQAIYYQIKEKIWNFYDEREFIENLLHTRFNFLLAAYALFIGALFTAQKDWEKIIISLFGLLLFILLYKVIKRLYKKTEFLLKIIRDLDPNHLHVANIIDKAFYGSKSFSIYKNQDLEGKSTGVNIFIGNVIPLFMIMSFIVFFIIYLTFFLIKTEFFMNIGFNNLCG